MIAEERVVTRGDQPVSIVDRGECERTRIEPARDAAIATGVIGTGSIAAVSGKAAC
jgi:hypothetical protein